MKWFKERDRNTKFFHSYVRGRRKKLHIESIKDIRGVEVHSNDQKGEIEVEYFQNQFSEEERHRDYGLLQHIPRLISEEQNEEMFQLPRKEEVRKVVFKLNGENASGPDCFSGSFFQHCWEIIGEDLTRLVKAFFCGQELPKFITHTNIVLIPKKEKVQEFKDLRRISLSNFTNKVISRMIHERIVGVLPNIISQNQSGFVKRRSITENVLLAQEIIRDMHLRNKQTNEVVKLDMAKASDRVDWIFLTKVLRKFGFSEGVIDMIWRLVSGNWYSIMINGQTHGFSTPLED
ncbi:hypothetical protein KY290_021421 [Solanum tuberosum]|uniref:Reverse transcriptase domain-containing protein n=1 Tax=Solanum tuberosum TaxID=4113 RepID=A0ABQ7V3L2_SOLTU|nr:hypothetical protein KY290_021421 [Solanum tuberosum]